MSYTNTLNHSRIKDIDYMDKDCVVRFKKSHYKTYQQFIYDIGVCQVCERDHNLDAPHHARYGTGNKDDRFLICICQECHREIHTQGYESLMKSREHIEDIGWQNFLNFSDY